MIIVVEFAAGKDVQIGKVATTWPLQHEYFGPDIGIPHEHDGGGQPYVLALQRLHFLAQNPSLRAPRPEAVISLCHPCPIPISPLDSVRCIDYAGT